MNIQVAILDNNKDHLTMMKLALEGEFNVYGTTDTNVFIDNVRHPAVVIMDWNLDYGIIGVDVMRRVRVKNLLCHAIYVSSLVTKAEYKIASNEGFGFFFIEKDDTNFFKDLVEKINRAKDLLRIKITESGQQAKRDELLKDQINKTLKALESNGRRD